jgi:deoxyribonucleoside regulator
MQVSQAKVSRFLSLARKRGIVRITVADYDARQRSLEGELMKQLGLSTAIIIKSMEDLPVSKVRDLTAHFAAPLIESLIPPGSLVAIAGGLSLQSIIHRLPMTSQAPTVIQAVGQIGAHINLWDAQELGRSVAEKWEGNFLPLNAPVYLPNKTACEALLELEKIQTEKKNAGSNCCLRGDTPDRALFDRGLPRQNGAGPLGTCVRGRRDLRPLFRLSWARMRYTAESPVPQHRI